MNQLEHTMTSARELERIAGKLWLSPTGRTVWIALVLTVVCDEDRAPDHAPIFWLVGPSGSGKTTSLRAAFDVGRSADDVKPKGGPPPCWRITKFMDNVECLEGWVPFFDNEVLAGNAPVPSLETLTQARGINPNFLVGQCVPGGIYADPCELSESDISLAMNAAQNIVSLLPSRKSGDSQWADVFPPLMRQVAFGELPPLGGMV